MATEERRREEVVRVGGQRPLPAQFSGAAPARQSCPPSPAPWIPAFAGMSGCGVDRRRAAAPGERSDSR